MRFNTLGVLKGIDIIMKICYCSLLLPDAEKLMRKTKSKLSFSRHKFGTNILEGLDYNSNGNVTVFNIINTVNFPQYKQLIFKTEEWSHNNKSQNRHVGYINLFIVKYITQYLMLKKNLKRWIKENGDEQLVIYVQDMYFPSVCAALATAKKRKNVKTCLMTGDLNGKYGLASDCSKFKNWLIEKKDNYINKKIKEFDSFVLVTKFMAEAMGVQDKPNTIMECLYSPENSKLYEVDNKETSEKIIFNAGAIREEYGISHLLRAFSMIQDENYRLWIAGGGDGVDEVKEYEKKDSRIKYLGFISPKQVEEYQQIATALINPRTSEHEFVKYSFASKNMECLASGKPYIAHRLPCNPVEYDDFIQYPINETDEALKDEIIKVCEMTKQERDKIGIKSRNFILKEKNPMKQCKKIYDMLENMWKC